MELFQPFFVHNPMKSIRRTRTSGDKPIQDDHPCPPLIKLLAIVTALDVNIFPLTWRPALEVLGEGLTGSVSQSPLNAQVAFAFKRFNPLSANVPGCSDAAWLSSGYDALLSEIIALSSSKIYDHPNVVNLEGLCWEIRRDSEEVWPVLVFRKADLGSLDKFLSFSSADWLSFDNLMAIAGDVAKGLLAFHDCNIVHGDIKPENILVAKSYKHQGFIGVKIADLGHSSFGDVDDEVKLPKSEPWEAPEYHDRWWPLEDAKRMDVFSFGLLVLWLLFRNESFPTDDGVETKLSDAFDHRNNARKALQLSKKSGAMLTYAFHLVSTVSNINNEDRRRLHLVFDLSLQPRNKDRAPDIRLLVDILSQGNSEPLDRNPSVTALKAPSWHGNVQLAEFCLELDSCDFRVQASVAKDFSHLAEWAECRSCSENAAFQLALCYTFGFGVRADSEQSRKWLLCSGKNNDDLNEALRRIKLMKPRLSAISQLVNLGFEGQLTSAYDADGILEQAIREYQAMTAARLQAFGPEHFLTIRMNNLLADVLCATDKEEEVVQASEIYKEGIRMLDKLYGPKNRATLVAKTGLARAYINLRLFKEAEIVAMEVFESYSSESEDDVALRLAALCDLASIALECGKYDKAIERGLEVIESGKEHLGPSQANVMRAKSVLALAYFRSGLAQEGVQLAEEAHKEKSVALGQEHPATLRSLQDLATMCTISSEWMKARNAWKEYSEMIQKLGFTARSILIARSNYAVTLARTGDAEIAVRICEDILSDMARNSKCMQEDVFGTKANLAIAHSYQNAWHKAEPLQREVLSFFQQRLDPCHVRVLLSLQGLSETLYHREKWDEAAEFASQEIRNRESVSSELDTDKLDALTRITRSKAELQKWADAVPQLEKELMWRKQMAKADSFDGLIATALTAIGQLHAHKREQAVDRIGEFFEAFKHIGLGNEYLVEQIYAMAAGAEENGLLEEAEECLKLALLCRRNIFPGTQGPRQEADEKRVLELRRRLGKSTVLEEIKLELTSTLIKRRREAQKQERP